MHDVVLIIGDMKNGGTERVYSTIANAWVKQGRKVCVITDDPPETDFFELDSGITRIALEGRSNSTSLIEGLLRNVGRIIKLRGAIRKAAAPVIVPALAPTAIIAILASWFLPVRVIVAERNDPARQSYGRIWDFLRRFLYPRADVVTANSRGGLAGLSHFVPGSKLKYLPNPLAPPPFPYRTANRQPIILNIARMYPHKGQRTLIDAFAKIAKKHPEWRLAIAGDGPLREKLHETAKRLSVEERIDWLGIINDPSHLYSKASIFVLPSHYEGMPNVLLEAMDARLAVVASNSSPGPLEVVNHDVTGLVFPTGDVAALADTLERLIASQELRLKLGNAAKEQVIEFELDHVLNIWNDILGLTPVPKGTKNEQISAQ